MNKVEKLHRANTRADLPEFGVGDTLRVHMAIVEAGKERLQPLQGTVIARSGGGVSERIILRRVSYGFGLELTIPLSSPRVSKIDVIRRGDVSRNKLYYLRDRQGKAARIKEAVK